LEVDLVDLGWAKSTTWLVLVGYLCCRELCDCQGFFLVYQTSLGGWDWEFGMILMLASQGWFFLMKLLFVLFCLAACSIVTFC